MPANHHDAIVILEIMVISIGLSSAWTLWGAWVARLGFERRMKRQIEDHVRAEFNRRGWYLAPAERPKLYPEEPQCAFRWPSGERCVTRKADHHPGLQHDYLLPATPDVKGSGT
jgi:hypothetical protein